MKQAGEIDDYAILDALRRKETISAKTALAAKAGVAVSVIDRACELRDAKAVVSMAWKAGLTAQTAVVLQAMLAQLPPDQILRPDQSNSYPLSETEMHSQLAVLGIGGEAGKRPWMPRRLSATTPQ